MTTRQAESLFSREEVTGVAVVCGQVSGLMVLDFDGQIGRDAFLELYGNGLIELERPTVITGSAGKHLYFALEPWAKTMHWHHEGSRAGELRASGGYVLAPPSRHPNGNLYVWNVQPLEPLQPMPRALREVLNLTRDTPKPNITAPVRHASNWILAKGRVSVQVLLKKANEAAPREGRNLVGFKLATWLRDNEYTQGEAREVLLEYTEFQKSQGQHPYNATEALASVRSAFSHPARKPWGRKVTS